MKNSAYELFEKMYLILDDLWKSNQEEDLCIYISDANPIFCENGRSLDPVVFEDFNNLYEQKKNSDITDYDFIVYYLDNLDPYYGDIKKYFISISKEEVEAKIY